MKYCRRRRGYPITRGDCAKLIYQLTPKGALTVQLLDYANRSTSCPVSLKKFWARQTAPSRFGQRKAWSDVFSRGLIDIGLFYSTETADLKIPAIVLPAEVALSARYTVTVLCDAAHRVEAIKFVDLLGRQGHTVLQEHGLDVVKPSVAGDPGKMPVQIRSEIDVTKRGGHPLCWPWTTDRPISRLSFLTSRQSYALRLQSRTEGPSRRTIIP